MLSKKCLATLLVLAAVSTVSSKLGDFEDKGRALRKLPGEVAEEVDEAKGEVAEEVDEAKEEVKEEKSDLETDGEVGPDIEVTAEGGLGETAADLIMIDKCLNFATLTVNEVEGCTCDMFVQLLTQFSEFLPPEASPLKDMATGCCPAEVETSNTEFNECFTPRLEAAGIPVAELGAEFEVMVGPEVEPADTEGEVAEEVAEEKEEAKDWVEGEKEEAKEEVAEEKEEVAEELEEGDPNVLEDDSSAGLVRPFVMASMLAYFAFLVL